MGFQHCNFSKIGYFQLQISQKGECQVTIGVSVFGVREGGEGKLCEIKSGTVLGE